MYVVEYYWHAVAWRLRQANISGNHRLKNLRAEESPEVCSNLP